jgi:hypothetical protein
MSATRVTIDTNILHVRNIFAPNVAPNSAPAIGPYGHFNWKSPLEFISSMGAVSSLTEMYFGLSSLSSICDYNIKDLLRSTVIGIGSSGYTSTSAVSDTATSLCYTHSYISSSSLYECVNNLTQLNYITSNIGPMVKFVRGDGYRFEPRGYVKTANPGFYRIYNSTIGLQGSNLLNTEIISDVTTPSGIIDIGGYRNLINEASKMRIDVEIGLEITEAGVGSGAGAGALKTIRTFLYASDPREIIGTPVVFDYKQLGKLGKITYFLTYADLASRPATLKIGHYCYSDAFDPLGAGERAGSATTNIPSNGGIFITLNNMD